MVPRGNERSDIFNDEHDCNDFLSDKYLAEIMQKDDDNSKNDVPEDDITGAITADEPTERKPAESERSQRVDKECP